MSYTPHTAEEIRFMLERIGIISFDELFDSVPAPLRAHADLKLPPALAERSLLEHMSGRLSQNRTAHNTASFLGGGAYDHFIPHAVDALAGRGEFATAYTPYQAEISQGTLQAIFEFQTLICQLTGQEVSNASLYDGASATAEAALMALRVSKRKRICVSAGLHPSYRRVLETYTGDLDVEIDTLPLDPSGRTELRALPDDTAALLVQYPNFFGSIEDVRALRKLADDAGALLVTTTPEMLALGVLRSPGELGADIVAGEAQSFGVPLAFGGPYAGILAGRNKHVRQLPGRLIGESLDSNGQRAFVMTLTTREQHIRRERATSNICTNQGLCALRVTIFLALIGKRGLQRLARVCFSLSEYAKEQLQAAGLELRYTAPTFNEFVVRVPGLERRLPDLEASGLLPGIALSRFDPERQDELLICTTELNNREQIDQLVRGLQA